MTQNFLMRNASKTEAIIVGPRKLIKRFSEGQITLHNITDGVTNLGVDQDMSFIKDRFFFHLRDIEKLDFFYLIY